MIRRALGAGATATVYEVTDESTGRRLALKQLRKPPPGLAAHQVERARLRFRREFHTVARLAHPCIVQVFDYGIEKEQPYYTMELLAGAPLADLVPLGPTEAAIALRDVAAALAILHAQNLVHRDVSPGNVRLGPRHAKLIDFGVIATAGISSEVAGTPPFIAPETARGLPFDHRADLFGLGALAYWLLTGSFAYPARRLRELENAWRHLPPPPSRLRDGVSAALDELVMSLLSLDPLARPRTAAEVVDRLTSVADLSPAPDLEVVGSYLSSASLVGRQPEMERLRRRVERLLAGRGGALVVEAPSGMGKSRVLRELALEAQMAGAAVVSVPGDHGDTPYAIVRGLARGLMNEAPKEALETARPYAQVIGRILPELAMLVPSSAEARTDVNPREERLHMQAELVKWILAAAARRALVLLVDDVQRCDEASAAVLASLAHAARSAGLLLACALREDEEQRAPAAIAALREASRQIVLLGLDPLDSEILVRSLIGDVDGVVRLAHWAHEQTAGSPLLITELIRSMVDRKAIRFSSGGAFIPDGLDAEIVPRDLRAAMDARVERLSAPARELAQALAVHGGELPLELLQHLLSTDERQLFDAQHELEAAGVASRSDVGVRFTHDGLREAALRSLDSEGERDLHRRIGEALAAGDVPPEREAEVGWHLLRGGEEARAADLLERAGRRLYELQSFSDAIPSLRAVIEVRERDGAPPGRTLELRRIFMVCAGTADRSSALLFAPQTIERLRRYAGLRFAERVRGVLGARVSLGLGLLLAGVRWLFTPPRRRGPGPRAALRDWVLVAGFTATVHMASYDVRSLGRLVATMEPLAVFRGRAPRALYLAFRSLLDYLLGRLSRVVANVDEGIDILRRDRRTPIPEVDRALAIAGMHGLRAMSLCLQEFPTADIDAMEKLGLRMATSGALQVRTAYHRWRGEEDRARELEQQSEILSVQLGSWWQLESGVSRASSLAFAHNHDLVGLRRSMEQMRRQIAAGCHFDGFLQLAEAEDARERGALEESRAALEAILAAASEQEELLRQPARTALADTLLELGEFEAALATAEQANAATAVHEIGRVPYAMRARRVMALAEAGMGRAEAAMARLDAAIALREAAEFPSVLGLLHEARARIALDAGDRPNYELSLGEMRAALRPTGNPALIARVERLAASDPYRAGAMPGGPAAGDEIETVVGKRRGHVDSTATVAERLAECTGQGERASRALGLLVDAAGGAGGHLYMRDRRGQLELIASVGEGRHSGGESANAERLVPANLALDPPTTTADTSQDGTWCQLALCSVDTSGARTPVGMAVIARGACELRLPAHELVEEVTRALLRS